jgi:hypothetical protein
MHGYHTIGHLLNSHQQLQRHSGQHLKKIKKYVWKWQPEFSCRPRLEVKVESLEEARDELSEVELPGEVGGVYRRNECEHNQPTASLNFLI